MGPESNMISALIRREMQRQTQLVQKNSQRMMETEVMAVTALGKQGLSETI